MKRIWLVLMMVLMPLYLFAEEVVETVPLEDPIMKLVDLVSNWKALGTLGIVSAIIIIIIQLLKTKLVGGWFTKRSPLWKRAILVTLGVISGIVLQVISGAGWIPALMSGLVSAGGAISIYEVIKPLFKKKDPA